MNIEESGFFSPVLAAGDRLGYVHIGENHRGATAQAPSTSTPSSEVST
jgi:hypothetical protein